MRSVTINFRPDTPRDRQERVLEAIRQNAAVGTVGYFDPGSQHPVVSRMAFAYVRDEASIDDLMKTLQAVPEIESVSLPAERRLA